MATVLVAEDDRYTRLLITFFLQEYGHRVLQAEDGEQAYDVVLNVPLDLAVLDVHMPKLNGHEVLARMKEGVKTQDVPIIILSAMQDSNTLNQAYSSGCNIFLEKPFNGYVFMEEVEKFITSKR